MNAVKLTKLKDKNIERDKGKMTTYKGTLIRVIANFSTETLQARREWHHIFKVVKGKNLQPRICYPARFSVRFDGETKAFQTSKS